MSLDALNAPVTKNNVTKNRVSIQTAVGVFALLIALLSGVRLQSFTPPALLFGAAGWAAWWQQKREKEKQDHGKRDVGQDENAALSVPLAEYNDQVKQCRALDADNLALQELNRHLQAQSDAQQALLDERDAQLMAARQEMEQARQQEQRLTLTVFAAQTEKETGEAERLELARRVSGMAEELSGQVVVCLAEAEQAISTAIEAFTRIANEAQEAAACAQQAVGTQHGSDVSGIATRATDVMESFIGGMLLSARKIAASARQLEGLGDVSRRLFSLLDDVRSVADQTGLVALNASIEAARAGAAGRTFGVVAKEVSKLAQTSRQTAERMRALTDEFSQATQMIQTDLALTAENSLEASCDAQGEVNRLLEMMQKADANTQAVLASLGERSGNITANYASIVMAFQFHDLLRQRLEHVAEPLSALSASLRGEAVEQAQEKALAYAVSGQAFHAHAIGAAPALEVVSYAADDDDNITLF